MSLDEFPTRPDLDALATKTLDIAREVRRTLGIGMFERVHQEALALALDDSAMNYQREVPVRALSRA